MKAISIKNPYATQILQESKNIEYRSWDMLIILKWLLKHPGKIRRIIHTDIGDV